MIKKIGTIIMATGVLLGGMVFAAPSASAASCSAYNDGRTANGVCLFGNGRQYRVVTTCSGWTRYTAYGPVRTSGFSRVTCMVGTYPTGTYATFIGGYGGGGGGGW